MLARTLPSWQLYQANLKFFMFLTTFGHFGDFNGLDDALRHNLETRGDHN